MVIGIIGLVAVSTCWGSFLGIILSPIALGLGLSGRRAADRGEGGGRGQAVAGFVMGIVGTVLSVLCIAFLVVMLVFYSEELDGNPGPGGSGDGPSLDARGSSSAPAVPLGTDAPGAGVPGAGVPVAAGSADTADRGA
jgi:hypothetical protein